MLEHDRREALHPLLSLCIDISRARIWGLRSLHLKPCLIIIRSPWHRNPGALKRNEKGCPRLSEVTKLQGPLRIFVSHWDRVWRAKFVFVFTFYYISIWPQPPCSFMFQVVQLVNWRKAPGIGINTQPLFSPHTLFLWPLKESFSRALEGLLLSGLEVRLLSIISAKLIQEWKCQKGTSCFYSKHFFPVSEWESKLLPASLSCNSAEGYQRLFLPIKAFIKAEGGQVLSKQET